MGTIKNNLNELNNEDIYSLLLFFLFKSTGIPDYAVLSELVFILDKNTLLKLCEYYGGMTITFPTIEDLEILLYSLLLYKYIEIDNIPYDDALILLNNTKNKAKVKENYIKLCDILNTYKFKNRNNGKY